MTFGWMFVLHPLAVDKTHIHMYNECGYSRLIKRICSVRQNRRIPLACCQEGMGAWANELRYSRDCGNDI